MPTSPISAKLPDTFELQVEPDDTLSEIAAKNEMSLEELLKLNPQFDGTKIDGKVDPTRNGNSGWDPDFIRPGDTIILRRPDGGVVPTGGVPGGHGGAIPVGTNGTTAPVGNPTTRQGKINEAMRYFQSQGWSAAQAAGIVANLQAESNYSHTAVGDGGAAYGIGQWHPDRQANFARVMGHSIRNSTFAEQLKFVQWELTQTESGAGNALKGAQSASEAAAIFCRLYERPADIAGQSQLRGRIAQQIISSHTNTMNV